MAFSTRWASARLGARKYTQVALTKRKVVSQANIVGSLRPIRFQKRWTTIARP